MHCNTFAESLVLGRAYFCLGMFTLIGMIPNVKSKFGARESVGSSGVPLRRISFSRAISTLYIEAAPGGYPGGYSKVTAALAKKCESFFLRRTPL